MSEAPRPNGDLIYIFKEADGPLGPLWSVLHAENVKVDRNVIKLTAYRTNETSLAILNIPLKAPFAVEIGHQITAAFVAGFGIVFAKSESLPRRLPECEGAWYLALLEGDGRYKVGWRGKKDFGVLDEAGDLRFTAALPAGAASTPYLCASAGSQIPHMSGSDG